jgi:hypothetical protein
MNNFREGQPLKENNSWDSNRQERFRKEANTNFSQDPNRYRYSRKPEDDHSQWGGFFRKSESREPEDRNIRAGEQLKKNYDRNVYDRYGHRRDNESKHRYNERNERRLADRDWDEGTYFHTGPSAHGSRQYQAERNHEPYNQKEEYFSNHYRNQDRQLRSMEDQHGHYGARRESVYRRPDNLNYGDRGQSRQQQNYVPFGSGYEPNRQPVGFDHNPHTEGPFSGSRYKEDDYRYGSGNHNFYKEGRYQRGGGIGHGFQDNKGFFERVGDGIRDTWDSITNRDEDNVAHAKSRYYRNDKDQQRDFDQSYESGPRWADESETHRTDRSNPYPVGHRRSTDPNNRSWTDFDAENEKRW